MRGRSASEGGKTVSPAKTLKEKRTAKNDKKAANSRARMAARIHGLDVAYDLGPGHPLRGRRMPDLDLDTDSGPTRVYALLHQAKPLLLNFVAPGRIDTSLIGHPGVRRAIRRQSDPPRDRAGRVADRGAHPTVGHVAWLSAPSPRRTRTGSTATDARARISILGLESRPGFRIRPRIL